MSDPIKLSVTGRHAGLWCDLCETWFGVIKHETPFDEITDIVRLHTEAACLGKPDEVLP